MEKFVIIVPIVIVGIFIYSAFSGNETPAYIVCIVLFILFMFGGGRGPTHDRGGDR